MYLLSKKIFVIKEEFQQQKTIIINNHFHQNHVTLNECGNCYY